MASELTGVKVIVPDGLSLRLFHRILQETGDKSLLHSKLSSESNSLSVLKNG